MRHLAFSSLLRVAHAHTVQEWSGGWQGSVSGTEATDSGTVLTVLIDLTSVNKPASLTSTHITGWSLTKGENDFWSECQLYKSQREKNTTCLLLTTMRVANPPKKKGIVIIIPEIAFWCIFDRAMWFISLTAWILFFILLRLILWISLFAAVFESSPCTIQSTRVPCLIISVVVNSLYRGLFSLADVTKKTAAQLQSELVN